MIKEGKNDGVSGERSRGEVETCTIYVSCGTVKGPW